MNIVLPMGVVGVSDQAQTRRELFNTEFYNDRLRRQENVIAGPCMVCYRSVDKFVGMAAACRARNVDFTLEHSQQLFGALAPQVTHAIRMAEVLPDGNSASFTHLQASRHAIFILRAHIFPEQSGDDFPATTWMGPAAAALVVSGRKRCVRACL